MIASGYEERISDNDSFLARAAAGRVPGHEVVQMVGQNPDIDDGQTEDVWAQGGFVEWSTEPENWMISSSNAGDTMSVYYDALTTDYARIQGSVPLSGQTTVAVGDFLRINSLFVLGSTANAGNIYLAVRSASTNGTPDTRPIRARILPGKNRAEQAFYTVPAGHSAFLKSYTVNGYVDAAAGMLFEYLVKRPGVGWMSAHIVGVAARGKAIHQQSCWCYFPAMSDIRIQATANGNNNFDAVGRSVFVVVNNDAL